MSTAAVILSTAAVILSAAKDLLLAVEQHQQILRTLRMTEPVGPRDDGVISGSG
jgi:hypothetical protein